MFPSFIRILTFYRNMISTSNEECAVMVISDEKIIICAYE